MCDEYTTRDTHRNTFKNVQKRAETQRNINIYKYIGLQYILVDWYVGEYDFGWPRNFIDDWKVNDAFIQQCDAITGAICITNHIVVFCNEKYFYVPYDYTQECLGPYFISDLSPELSEKYVVGVYNYPGRSKVFLFTVYDSYNLAGIKANVFFCFLFF